MTYFLSIEHIFDIILNAFHIAHLILTTILCSRLYYYPSFIDEKNWGIERIVKCSRTCIGNKIQED